MAPPRTSAQRPADRREPPPQATEIAPSALDWYDRHRRDLPWRSPPGCRPDPYHVWLSEVMLQQTTVATVAGYFHRFVARWPTVVDLAAAEREEVLKEWAGLGYYARARNLHACAVAVVERHGGRFPATADALRSLPGIGDYTSAAIAAIAFGQPAAVMDGNIERVISRLFAVTEALPGSKPLLKGLVADVTPQRRPGDFAQAMMDIGAGICTPRRPKCMVCPLSSWCDGRAQGIAESLPQKTPKTAKPTRRAVAFWVTDRFGAVLIRQRPDKGLLGGMMEVPSSEWRPQTMPTLQAVIEAAPVNAAYRLLPGIVRHTFTHFHLEIAVAVARAEQRDVAPGGRWVSVERLGDQALPTVMRKIAQHAYASIGQSSRPETQIDPRQS